LKPFVISSTELDARFRGHDGFDEFEPSINLSFPRKRESQRMASNLPSPEGQFDPIPSAPEAMVLRSAHAILALITTLFLTSNAKAN
jgi:hypothetical protein